MQLQGHVIRSANIAGMEGLTCHMFFHKDDSINSKFSTFPVQFNKFQTVPQFARHSPNAVAPKSSTLIWWPFSSRRAAELSRGGAVNDFFVFFWGGRWLFSIGRCSTHISKRICRCGKHSKRVVETWEVFWISQDPSSGLQRRPTFAWDRLELIIALNYCAYLIAWKMRFLIAPNFKFGLASWASASNFGYAWPECHVHLVHFLPAKFAEIDGLPCHWLGCVSLDLKGFPGASPMQSKIFNLKASRASGSFDLREMIPRSCLCLLASSMCRSKLD